MAFQEKIGARSVRLAMSALALIAAGNAAAQEAPMQRVEITGSAIKRIAVEGALPVQRLSAETIKKTGANTVAELIQALPAMQGFTVEATAAGSNSGGRVSASIHDIGESYTLVLLNGRRIAPQNDGSTVNLNAIPMSAIERVEILTDGASALYGSDAIAGVINFIMKKNFNGVNLEANFSQPFQSSSGRQTDAAITFGSSDLLDGRLALMGTYRHDERTQLRATERDFAKTSFIPFGFNGKNYVMDRTSTSAVPGNVTVDFNDKTNTTFNPYLLKNGKCAPMNVVVPTNQQTCGFDSGSTVEIVPQSKRDTFFGNATFKLTDNVNLFAETVIGRFDLTARIAPNAMPVAVPVNSAFYTNYVQPYLTPAQQANLAVTKPGVSPVNANYRSFDWGTRDSQTVTDTQHFVTGLEGDIGAWNFNSGLTWSRNKYEERYVGGYQLNKEFRSMIANGSFDPFAALGPVSDATRALIDGSTFRGAIRNASTTMTGIDARASRELFDLGLGGGSSSIALGGDVRRYHYEQTPTDAAKNGLIYNLSSPATYDMTRKTYGLFTELLVPVVKSFEVTGAVRYDAYTAIDNGVTGTEMGKKESAVTYKVSTRWQPNSITVVRASYGTGFKAPDMLNIGQPLVPAGVTASKYACPNVQGNSGLCKPGALEQYPVMSGGNVNLKPEKSKQFTIGFRVEPANWFSAGADLWDVKIRDAVSSVSEQLAFDHNGNDYPQLFTTFTEPASGKTFYAFQRLSINIGQTHNQGIDWDMTGRHNFSFGRFSSTLAGTYLIKSDYTKPGTSDQWTNSMNFFGINNAVSFRHVVRWTNTLETGAFSNSITANYRNGYTDAKATVWNLGTNATEDVRIHVPSHLTFDWQGKWAVNKQLSLRAGIKNLADRNPPLSLRNSSGHQVGFDPRYADPMGRTFYLNGNYSF
ncbi:MULTISPECIES: TonB-dependent receptor [unclassified Duganella]|uniref:TonB-dependent receptor n=1 Tax=unclassified Duganella TaxID=2636909 RepID=UPI0006FDE6B7|nr:MULTISPECIES: TonB-dependent receptor [unclassified Duganella]KQV54386.1 TonB-dependent receptor [Duganella sp. Root336D2]KRC03513.1 TonB-dependent receptor [Duganella sp. Root198D2]